MRTPSTSPSRFAGRLAAAGLTLLVATAGGVGSAAAADSEEAPLGVLAPVTNAFSDTEATPVDRVLDQVVPDRARDAIGTALTVAEAATTPGEGPGDSGSATRDEDDSTAITVAPDPEPVGKTTPRDGKGHPRPRG